MLYNFKTMKTTKMMCRNYLRRQNKPLKHFNKILMRRC